MITCMQNGDTLVFHRERRHNMPTENLEIGKEMDEDIKVLMYRLEVLERNHNSLDAKINCKLDEISEQLEELKRQQLLNADREQRSIMKNTFVQGFIQMILNIGSLLFILHQMNII